MSTEARQDEMLAAAIEYARLGWRVVPLKDGKSKHPVKDGWQKLASCDPDTIRRWMQEVPGRNIGVKLGPDSGIIDVECDSDLIEMELQRVFKEGVPRTPTWRSTRGTHRLFRYRPDLPRPDMNGFKVFGIEFRTGMGGKGAQSVMPPSLHPSGKHYEWIIKPSECEVADLPEYVWPAIWNCEGEEPLGFAVMGSVDVHERARRYLATLPPAVSGQEGSRPTFNAACVLVLGFDFSTDEAFPLLREYSERCVPPWSEKELRHKLADASKKPGERGYLLNRKKERTLTLDYEAASKPSTNGAADTGEHAHETLNLRITIANMLKHVVSLDDDTMIKSMLDAALAINAGQTKPASESKVREMFVAAIKKEAVRRVTEEAKTIVKMAPEDSLDGTKPSTLGFRLVIVNSVPPRYKLYAPHWATRTNNGYIRLTAKQMTHFESLREEALSQAKFPLPKSMAKFWDAPGGLYERLVSCHEVEEASEDVDRPFVMASKLYEAVSSAREVEGGNSPDSVGRPRRLTDGSVVFKFDWVWRPMRQSDDQFSREEFSALLDWLGVESKSMRAEVRGTGATPKPTRFKVITPDGVRKLEKIIDSGKL